MKKFGKISLVGLLASAVLFSATGCLGKPPQQEIPDDPTGGGSQTTVDDVYDYNGDGTGSTRPEIPGGSYEPSLPITETTVRISDSTDITFADGSKQKTLSVGVRLTEADFDASTLGGREIDGLAVMRDGGEISGFIALPDFAPLSDVTVIPYFKPENGERLLFGSNGLDYGTGNFKNNESNIVMGNAVINGFAARTIGYDGAVNQNDRVRVKSTFTRVKDTTYTYYYTFVNYGDETLSFTAYQINGGDGITGSDVTASDPIVLEPGASKSVVIVHEINKSDSNAMTNIKFDGALEHGFKLGVIMGVTDFVEKVPAKITVELPDGLALDASYVTDVTAGDALVLPTDDQITGGDFDKPDGWCNVETQSLLSNGSKIQGDMTIAPYWETKKGYEYLTVGKGANYGYNYDLTPGDFWINDKEVAYKRSSFTYLGATHAGASARVVNAGGGVRYLGSLISDTQAVTAGSAIRIDSTYAVGSSPYEFCYTVSNNGTTQLRLSIYQIKASSEYKSNGKPAFYQYESRYRADIDLAPGEVISKTAQYSDITNANNALTYIVFEEDVDSFSFGLSIGLKQISAVDDAYKNQPELGNNVTIGYDADKNHGVTVSADYLTQRAGRLMVAPTSSQYTCPAGERVKGWKLVIDGTEYVLPTGRAFDGVRLPSKATAELVPVFAEYKTVTLDLPEGVTLDGYAQSVKVYDGETLTLPTSAQVIVADGRKVLFWVAVGSDGSENRISDGATVTENITIKPVLSDDADVPVTMERGTLENGFTVSDEYIGAARKLGDKLVLPTESQYTNTTGKKLTGWTVTDKDTGDVVVENALTTDVTISSLNLVIEPVLKAMATVTVNLPDGLTLNGYAVEQAVGDTLVLPTADQIAGEGYGAPTGWYDVSNKSIINNKTISGNITIAPYWQTENGYNYISVGSGANYGYNYDQTPGDFYDSSNANNVRSTLKYSGARSGGAGAAQIVVAGGNVAYLGSTFSDTQAVTAGSAFRIDSKYTIDAAAYEFIYTVYNGGTSQLRLSIYQVSGSAEYKSSGNPAFYQYESRYRVDIDLAPGESISKLAQYSLGSNGNALTYIVFEEDVDSFNFGISIGVKKIGSVADEYKNQAALANNVTMSYDSAAYRGVTVDEAYLSQRAGRLVVAPTSSQYTAPDGVTVTGWKIKIGGVEYDLPASRAFGGLRLPSKATVELVPVMPLNVNITVKLPEGITLNGYDVSGLQTGQSLTLPTSAQISGADASGRTIAGWYDTATGKAVADGMTLTGDMTIAPYFNAKDTHLTPMYTTDNNPFGLDNASKNIDGKLAKEGDVIGGDEIGTRLTCSVDMAKGDAFRLKTKVASISKANKYTFTYRFTNYGSTTLKFTLYQVNSGVSTTGMDSKDVEIAAGETAVVTLTLSGVDNSGAHALSYFVMSDAASGFNLGIAMSMTTEKVQ